MFGVDNKLGRNGEGTVGGGRGRKGWGEWGHLFINGVFWVVVVVAVFIVAESGRSGGQRARPSSEGGQGAI